MFCSDRRAVVLGEQLARPQEAPARARVPRPWPRRRRRVRRRRRRRHGGARRRARRAPLALLGRRPARAVRLRRAPDRHLGHGVAGGLGRVRRVLVRRGLLHTRSRLLGPSLIRPRVLDHAFDVFAPFCNLGLAGRHASISNRALLLLAHYFIIDLADVSHQTPFEREVPLQQLLLVGGDAASRFPLALR